MRLPATGLKSPGNLTESKGSSMLKELAQEENWLEKKMRKSILGVGRKLECTCVLEIKAENHLSPLWSKVMGRWSKQPAVWECGSMPLWDHGALWQKRMERWRWDHLTGALSLDLGHSMKIQHRKAGTEVLRPSKTQGLFRINKTIHFSC